MADASQVHIWIVPANGSASNPVIGASELGPSDVRRILLTWPAGCAGQVFVQIRASGGFAFPNQSFQYMAFDDYTYSLDVSNQTATGHWSLSLYNLDAVDHAIQVVYEFNYLRGGLASSTPQQIAI